MTQPFDTYLSEHRQTHLEQLFKFLQFPSISTLPEHAADVRACAQFLAEHVRQLGFENVAIMETEGHPVVYADWLHAEGKPTVLVYGHYDVQPVDPLDLWDTAPFEPQIRDGKLFARGATDDKGWVFMHLKAFEALFQTTGSLPVNVKLCLEGEEEIGSAHLPQFLTEHKDKFEADVVVISDTTMLAPNQPSVCYGLRGLTALQVDVRGAKGDLHSGLYGGAVPNAVHALVEILASLHDENYKVSVDGFYDDVIPLTADEREAWKKLNVDERVVAEELGLSTLVGEEGYSYLERVWARPTLEINGVYGGFQGAGTKTVIPAEAHAKITCRLVPNQDPSKIQQQIAMHVKKHAPEGVQVDVKMFDSGNAYVTPFHHPAIQWAAKAMEKAYGVPAAFTRMGGSIPIVEAFHRLLGAPSVMMGFGQNDENFHAPNEFMTLSNFDKGLRAMCYYWLGLDTSMFASK